MPSRILDPSQIQRLSKHMNKLLAATLLVAGGVATYYLDLPSAGATGARIEAPADGATLVEANDKGASCNDGFQIDVRVRTNVVDGTAAVLTANGLRVGAATVAGGLVTFVGAQLGSAEDTVLVADLGSTRAISSVKVRCQNHRACSLIGPTWSPEHPTLNARRRGTDLDAGADAAADAATWVRVGGGDSYSSNGAPYQISVEGKSAVQAGGAFEVFVDGASVGRVAKMQPGNEVRIDGVPLVTDGSHSAYLKCIDSDGSIGFSARSYYTIDSAAPQLVPINVSLGYVFGGASLIDGNKIRICASTTSADAIDLSERMGQGRLNFCAGVGTSTPLCAAVSTHGADQAYDGGTLPEAGAICDGAPGCVCSDAGQPAAANGSDASYNAANGCTSYYLPGGGVAIDCPTRCNGCPTGTTPSLWGGADNYKCSLPDGAVLSVGSCGCQGSQTQTLPDGNVIGLTPTWDGGCYACPNDGGAACIPTFAIGLDAGCRQCQYTALDGATSAEPWVCPWCTDDTKTRNGGCVDLECPGPSPFALRLSLYDGARNVTTKIIESIQCQVSGTSVQIVDPVGGSLLEIVEDINKRVLASTTTSASRRDKNPAVDGAQYDVVACTDAVAGTQARLFAGLRGRALTQIATAVVPGDAGTPGSCPYTRAVTFASVTLPESGEDGLGRLTNPTELRVDVLGADGGVSSSPLVDLWVDTTVPTFSFPAGFCGSTFDAAPRNARIHTNTLPVTIEVQNEQGTTRHTITDFAPSEYY